MTLRHLKESCAGCEQQHIPMNKEHVFPKWLILRTRTNATGVRWGARADLPALAATFPLCERCNKDFGRELEKPTARLFTEIESGMALSDDDAELLVRWLWKIKGLDWIASHPGGDYSAKYTLRERVLLPIDQIRGHLTLAISLIGRIRPEFGDLPMGVDSATEHDAIFVSGVFSRIALMVLLSDFANLVPDHFGRIRLAPANRRAHAGKMFYPPTSFRDDVEAVGVTYHASVELSKAHDDLALAVLQSELNEPANRALQPPSRARPGGRKSKR